MFLVFREIFTISLSVLHIICRSERDLYLMACTIFLYNEWLSEKMMCDFMVGCCTCCHELRKHFAHFETKTSSVQ